MNGIFLKPVPHLSLSKTSMAKKLHFTLYSSGKWKRKKYYPLTRLRKTRTGGAQFPGGLCQLRLGANSSSFKSGGLGEEKLLIVFFFEIEWKRGCDKTGCKWCWTFENKQSSTRALLLLQTNENTGTGSQPNRVTLSGADRDEVKVCKLTTLECFPLI